MAGTMLMFDILSFSECIIKIVVPMNDIHKHTFAVRRAHKQAYSALFYVFSDKMKRIKLE